MSDPVEDEVGPEDPNDLAASYPVAAVMPLGRKFTAAFVGPAMGKGLTPLSYWVCHNSEERAKEYALKLGGHIWCKFLSDDDSASEFRYYCQGPSPSVWAWPGLVGPCAALSEYLDYCGTCGHLKKSHNPLACTIVMGGIMSGPCDCKSFVAQ